MCAAGAGRFGFNFCAINARKISYETKLYSRQKYYECTQLLIIYYVFAQKIGRISALF